MLGNSNLVDLAIIQAIEISVSHFIEKEVIKKEHTYTNDLTETIFGSEKEHLVFKQELPYHSTKHHFLTVTKKTI